MGKLDWDKGLSNFTPPFKESNNDSSSHHPLFEKPTIPHQDPSRPPLTDEQKIIFDPSRSQPIEINQSKR